MFLVFLDYKVRCNHLYMFCLRQFYKNFFLFPFKDGGRSVSFFCFTNYVPLSCCSCLKDSLQSLDLVIYTEGP